MSRKKAKVIKVKKSVFDIAVYRCIKCRHKWEQAPAPTQCPKCKHLYCTWENYKEWYAHNGHKIRKECK